ncbi:hypothetical protein DFR50_11448 [Roseiarcus fermentans]|uniref:Uncharacterized protein n=1 Tax=Roseiarcus fermentans TaxID=1473586 RepID=A0A366FEQ3_9HYPH|nr:hypothetical protein [Roseiarcus fermentans]RBP12219.1 hypothetical protein DFR50_11448 [Roseiarcus fermentans]
MKGAARLFAARRPRAVRLGVDFEATALLANLGAEAGAVARQRAEEASSDEMAQDWADVADVIAQRTRSPGSGAAGPGL